MTSLRTLSALLLVVGAGLWLSSCQDDGQASGKFQWLPAFGDGSHDITEVIARVGDVEITRQDLDLRMDELPPAAQSRYQGPEGQRLLLKDMIDQLLMVQGAVKQQLYNDRDVARTLISQRRSILDSAMRNYGLLRDRQPTEDEVMAFYRDNRDRYRQQGLVMARHIECLGQADAQKAYDKVRLTGRNQDFLQAVKDFTVNIETGKQGGDLGWFNRGGFVPYIKNAKALTEAVFDLDIGLHPPIQVGDRWHVVEIQRRESERPMTFVEARETVLKDMLPGFQDQIVKDFLLAARQETSIEMLGEYAPGRGMTPDEIFARAMAVGDPETRIDLFRMLHTDFPKSDRADDALFLAATISLEKWQDRRIAERYLKMLIEEYPDSELVSDATFLKDNLYNPEVLNPSSIEQLRR